MKGEFVRISIDVARDLHRRLRQAALGCQARYPEALNKLGEAYLYLGRAEQAVKASRAAVGIRFGFASAHLNLGVALNKLGQSDEAEEQFRETLVLAPQTAAAHIELGLILAQSDGTLSPRARVELVEGLRLDPGLRSKVPGNLLAQLQ